MAGASPGLMFGGGGFRAGVAYTCAFFEERVAAVPPGSPALDRLQAAIEAHVLVVLEIGDYTSAQKLQARSGWGQWPACTGKLGLR